ncbi:acyl-CoA dehydrogenase family protein [Robbsia andropogonis]|uniref:acyl-CoA dehydrogenase family protein n=1 Tax=Robbsia andropogonis TaxID=28092 RepID=UPI000AC78D9F|nr:hypothetical protein [Robbsia andropogonis]
MNRVDNTSIHESAFSSQKGRKIRDAVLNLVPIIRENAPEGEKLGCLPPATLEALDKAGAFKLSVPEKFGGYALGARDLAEIISGIAQGDGAAGWVSMIASGFARVMLTFPDKTVEEVYRRVQDWQGPVVASASLFSDRIQRARRVDGGYVVESGGKWGFASGCKHAAFLVVGAQVDDVRGMILLERGQYEIVDDWNVMGLCGSSSNSIVVKEDVFVPEPRFADLANLPENLGNLRNRFRDWVISWMV